MTLTWTLDARTEPSADSWAAMLPPESALAPPVSAANVSAAVRAALQSGPLTSAQIEAATGLPRERIRVALWNMSADGKVVARGMGRGSTWRLA
jgi:hypothetical protein